MKKFLILGLGLILTAGFYSCKDDVIINSEPSLDDVGGETGYISFKIKNANTGGLTRAWLDGNGDYDQGNGEQTENFAGEYEVVKNVQSNRVFFFNADGTFHSSSFLDLVSKDSATDDEHKDGYDETETVYSASVKRTSDRDVKSWPTQCLVILNGRPTRLNELLIRAQTDPSYNLDKFLEYVNTDLSETDASEEGETLGLYKYSDGKYYFTMTNSIFVDDIEKSTGDNGQVTGTKGIVSAAQITEENLQTTSKLAAQHPVTVFVERIMSKVEVGFTGFDSADDAASAAATANVSYITEATPYGFVYTFTDDNETNSKWFEEEQPLTLKALITNWTVNAVEYQTKLFKNVDESWISTDVFEGWNDPAHHRSYWGIDNNYYWEKTKYPTQYRSVYDGSTSARPYQDAIGWGYGNSTVEKNGNDIYSSDYQWALDYKPYNKILRKRAYKYCLENTFSYDENSVTTAAQTGSYRNMIMGSHVLIQARLLSEAEYKNLNSDGSSKLDDEIGDKYYYSGRYYDEATYINRQVKMLQQLVGEQPSTKVRNVQMWKEDADGATPDFTIEATEGNLYVEKDGKYLRVTLNDTPKENEEISFKDVFTIAPAYVAKGDGKVTIALKKTYGPTWDGEYGYDSPKVNLYYYTSDQMDEDVIKPDQVGKPTQMTRNQFVSIIYQVPQIADCFKNGRMYYAVPIQHKLASGEGGNYNFKYDGLKIGDYGMVRNHWYKFVINQIMKPGIPVHDENQPIIPNYDDEDRYIGLEVIVLPWHIVHNGNVTLGQ